MPRHASPSSSSSAASAPRPWKGKARATQPLMFPRDDGAGGESGIVLPLEMLVTNGYETLYTVPLVVGNTQNLSVQVDTGSSDLWIASTSCNTQACKQTGGNLYDPSRSIPTNSLNQFSISYVEGAVTGPIVWDAVDIGGYNITYQALAAANNVQSEPLSADFTGVLGLALPANSIIASDVPVTTGNSPDGAVLVSNLFSITPSSSAPDYRFLSLTLERPGTNVIPSLLGIGRHPDFISDTSKVQYAAVVPSATSQLTFWETNVMDISVWVNGSPESVSLGTSAATGGVPTAVIDSGMPIILTSVSIANGIYGALGIGPASDGQYYMPCTTPINMTVSLDNRTAIVLHPLDLSTPNSDSSCLGLIQSYPAGSSVAKIADIIFGVPFMRSVYTVMAYDQPDANGVFPGPTSDRSNQLHPRLGLLGLTNATQALDEFHTVRVLNQPLPQAGADQGTGSGGSGGGSPGSAAAAQPAHGKKLSVGVEVLIGLVGFFVLCFALFGARWLVQRRRLRSRGLGLSGADGGVGAGGEGKEGGEVMMQDVAYRLARRSSYGSRYGPSEETIRAKRYEAYMRRTERQSAYTDDTARTHLGEDSDVEKFPPGMLGDAELGYRPLKRHWDSLSSEGETGRSPRPVDPHATLVGSPPLEAKDIDFNPHSLARSPGGTPGDIATRTSISTADYPPSPTHARVLSAEGGVAVPLLAHTRNDSRVSLNVPAEENMAGRGRVPLGMGRPASRARVGSVGSMGEVDVGGERRVSYASVHSRASGSGFGFGSPLPSPQPRSPVVPTRELQRHSQPPTPSFDALLLSPPPLVNLGLHDASQLSVSAETTNGHVS